MEKSYLGVKKLVGHIEEANKSILDLHG